jgi:hypothetical protein
MNRLRPASLAFSGRLDMGELTCLHMGKQLDDRVRLVADPIGELRLEAVLADAEASDAKAE